jgi:predicted acylesterase/phospholipase RssA
MSGDSSRWWAGIAQERQWDGVFKGGGAKGILYTGALEEFAKRGLWFRAVAGSSAGAITAALVAAGMRPEVLQEKATEGLGLVKFSPAGDLFARPLFGMAKVRPWLEERLREQLGTMPGTVAGGPVTFGQMYDATGIELFVVAVDVVVRQPRVFGSRLTPALSVTEAVIASCAIPVGFRAGRLRLKMQSGAEEVHRLIDGGVWANYPAFVFKDRGFRRFHDLPDSTQSRVIGFVLDAGQADDRGEPLELLPQWSGSHADKGGYRSGGILRNGLVRAYLFSLIPAILAIQFIYSLSHGGLVWLRNLSRAEWTPGAADAAFDFFNGFFTHFTPPLWGAAGVLIGIAAMLTVLGFSLFDSGLPAARTLVSVGTDVPYWVDADTDPLVRLRVPAGLSTLTFRLSAT